MIFSRFRVESDESKSLEKWTTPCIFEMYRIFEDLNISSMLDDTIDTRESNIDDLTKNQLRNECQKRGISDIGKKVEHRAS